MLYGPRVRYLDHNATTPLDPRVRDAVIAVLSDERLQANPSSVHGPGQRVRAVIEQARRAVAAAVGAAALELTFTSGGSEADNLAILGAGRALRAAGRPAGLLTTALEHPAVLACAQALAREGHAWVRLGVDGQGRVDPDELARLLRVHPEIGLVSLAAANHELGNAYDIAGLVRVVRESAPQALVHSDAVQAFGKIPVDLHAWDLDLMSLSAHKIHGPKGAGALIHRKSAKLEPLWQGGTQERGRRVGTENPLALHGFGVAAELVRSELAARREQVATQVASFREGMAAIAGIVDDERAAADDAPALDDPEAARAAARRLLERVDARDGGFGRAPKFPNPTALEILATIARGPAGDELATACGNALRLTLDRMYEGGIYDHLRGGFARYSTDREWLVPHFEKMLYDNAQLARVYVEAYQVTKDERFRRTAVDTLDYVLREMQAEHGGYFCATDADSESAAAKPVESRKNGLRLNSDAMNGNSLPRSVRMTNAGMGRLTSE